MSSQPSTLDRPVHITCRRCKHFHKNWEYPLPPSGGRVKCERCHADMFALGRADTQYTLASVDSIPLSELETNAASGPAGCSFLPHSRSERLVPQPSEYIAQQPPLSVGERQPMLSARSPLHGTESRLPQPESAMMSESDSFRSPSQFVPSIYVRLLQKVPYLETLLGGSEYVNTLGARFAAGLPHTRREYSIFGWRFVIHPPDHDADHPTSSATNTGQPSNVAAAESVQFRTPIVNEPLDHANSDVRLTPPLITSAQAIPSGDIINGPATSDGPSDHLIQHRRQKTLVRNALQQLNCRCTGDCHCILRTAEPPASDSEFGDAHSSRVRTPPNLDEVPYNPVLDRIGAQRFLHFSYFGQPTESSDYSLDTSQASTLGSGGSVMLQPGRPRLTLRSRSVPGY